MAGPSTAWMPWPSLQGRTCGVSRHRPPPRQASNNPEPPWLRPLPLPEKSGAAAGCKTPSILILRACRLRLGLFLRRHLACDPRIDHASLALRLPPLARVLLVQHPVQRHHHQHHQ